MSSMIAVVFASIATAAPTFEADRPEDAALAAVAWEAATECAGRPGASAAKVPIRRGYGQEGAIQALATWDGKGLAAIDLTDDAPAVMIAHELAHAWIYGHGPLAPLEGRAELLAECVARAVPDVVPYLFDAFPSLEPMPDLRTWTHESQGRLSPEQVSAAYTGSLRLFEAIGEGVPQERLFAAGAMSWAEVDRLLAEVGTPAEPILAALGGGAEAQRAALEDVDQDGLSALREEMRGTDPELWDTDGDGWWDGAPEERPEGALPVPRDGTPVCPPRWSPDGKHRFVWGGTLRGHALDARVASFGGHQAHIWVPEAASRNPGGLWFEIVGVGLEPSPGCAVSEWRTLRAFRGALDHLGTVDQALEQALAAARRVHGAPPARLVVDLGGKETFSLREGGFVTVVLSESDLDWAVKEPARLELLAGFVVARHWLHSAGFGRQLAEEPSLIAAFHGTWSEARIPSRLAYVSSGAAAEITRSVEGCGGWASWLGGGCPGVP